MLTIVQIYSEDYKKSKGYCNMQMKSDTIKNNSAMNFTKYS